MRIGIVAAVLIAGVTLVTACEDGNGGGVGLVDAPTRYRAARMVFDNGTGLEIDLVEDGGIFDLDLNEAEGTFRSSFLYDAIDLDVSGTYEITGSEIVFSDDPFEEDDLVLARSFGYTSVGDVLVLEDAAAAFDLDGDGQMEVATLEVWLEPI